jgi:hypothetical protein
MAGLPEVCHLPRPNRADCHGAALRRQVDGSAAGLKPRRLLVRPIDVRLVQARVGGGLTGARHRAPIPAETRASFGGHNLRPQA